MAYTDEHDFCLPDTICPFYGLAISPRSYQTGAPTPVYLPTPGKISEIFQLFYPKVAKTAISNVVVIREGKKGKQPTPGKKPATPSRFIHCGHTRKGSTAMGELHCKGFEPRFLSIEKGGQ
jgi:hypothetical protein